MPLNSREYEISVTSVDGCERKVKTKVEVIKNYLFEISNIMSPNDDGRNDRLRYYTDNSGKSLLNFIVFDRWGNIVFELSDAKPGWQEINWESIFRSKSVNLGAYTWIAKVQYIDDVVIKHQGSLMIIK
jgi:gliding motility-associated-like protein